MKKILTLDELNVLCKKYQKLLRIQDWEIDIQIVHPDELEDRTALAEVNARLHSMYATIKFANPQAVRDTFTDASNMHVTLIHELLHVVFHGMGPSDENAKIYDSLWESGIDRTANAIYQLSVAVDAGATDESS